MHTENKLEKVFQVFQDLQEPCVGKYLKIQNLYLKKKKERTNYKKPENRKIFEK